MSQTSVPPKSRLWLFALWLTCFYTTWLTVVIAGDYWPTVRAHWPISVAMAFGSYIAGSTPMGGGTVGFPVLVLLLDQPGSLGRNFGLAVQSIGMVSASIYILCTRKPLDWHLLRPALAGTLIGMPIGAYWIAPVLPDLWVKLTFAVVWASFGIMHLVKLRELVSHHPDHALKTNWDGVVGFTIGTIGGLIAAVTGVGTDMLIYAVLVLMYRADLKTAIPTSVLLMAFASLIGIAVNNLLAMWNPSVYGIDPEVFANWLAAAPIVALGAPFGALVVSLISRTPTLILVSVLCILQFLWTVIDQQVRGVELLASLVAIVVLNLVFMSLYAQGRQIRTLESP